MAKYLGSSEAYPFGCTKGYFGLRGYDHEVQCGWNASHNIKAGQLCHVYQLDTGITWVCGEKLSEQDVEKEAERVTSETLKLQKRVKDE